MLHIRTIPALLTLVTILGTTANAQLFRRNDPTAEKSMQQQRSQSDPRQRAASQPNKLPSNLSNNSLNNQPNRSSQNNRNNSPEQTNKAMPPRNNPQQYAGANGRHPSAPKTRSDTPQPDAQSLPLRSLLQDARNELLNAQQPNLPRSQTSARADQSMANPNLSTGPNLRAPNTQSRQTESQVNSFASPPIAKPSYASGVASKTIEPRQQKSDTDNAMQIGDSSNAQARSLSDKKNSVSEAEILDRFGLLFDPQGDGLVIAQVRPNTSAATTGLRVNDKLTSIGGALVTTRSEFFEIARLLSAGDQIEIEFERAGVAEKSFIQYGTSSTTTGNGSESENIDQGSVQLSDDAGWLPTKDDRTARLEQQLIAQQRIIQDLQARIRQLEAESSKRF